MLRIGKSVLFRSSRMAGIERAVGTSSWRRRRVLILGYHGVSLDDEHTWDSSLFMSPSTLRRRFEILREMGCTVLALSDAVSRLNAGTLPEQAVVLTFDDGLYDFLVHVAPLAEEFGYPVTVYLSTYYSAFPSPVFPVMLSYLLWKARGRRLKMNLGEIQEVDVTPSNHAALISAFARHVLRNGLSGSENAPTIGGCRRRAVDRLCGNPPPSNSAVDDAG